jgi:hypothetical protein
MRRLSWLPCALILLSACDVYFGPDREAYPPESPPPATPSSPSPEGPGCSDEFCSPSLCTEDAECAANQFCDEVTGLCHSAEACESSDECAPLYACSARGLCVPSPCRTHSDCMEGCYCDIEANACIEGGFCQNSSDCLDGFVCETGRETCEPEPEPHDEEECGD